MRRMYGPPNGQAIRSCPTSLKGVAGKEITTIEGIATMHPVQKAWKEVRVPQCGYCQTGQIMQAIALLKETRIRVTRTLTPSCRAISAAAEPIRGSGQPFTRPRRRRHEHRKRFTPRIPAGCSCRRRVRPERPLRSEALWAAKAKPLLPRSILICGCPLLQTEL